MSEEEHYRKLEYMYLSARCNRYYEPSIHIRKGEAEVRIPVTPKLHHAAHAAHGAVYFKVADDAAFFATNSLVEETFVLTTNLNLYLTKPIIEGVIIGRGKVTFASKNLFHAESLIVDGEGKELGRATASFVRGRQPLGPEVGYALPGA